MHRRWLSYARHHQQDALQIRFPHVLAEALQFELKETKMNNEPATFDAVTITLNPAIDRTVSIPNFTAGAVNRTERDHENPGGKGVNVASVLADYGHRIAVTGFLGLENCASFEALFARKKIADHFVRIAGHTRVGIKITDPILKQTTDINFPGPALAPGDLDQLHEQLGRLDCDWFVLAGSLPPGVDSAIYRDMITKLKARGGKVILDTSGDALSQAIEAAPNVIKPNLHELEALVGGRLQTETSIIKAARELVAKGIELVAVSMGKDGACFVTAVEVIIARPPVIEVISTVGAGDAMVAGIVAAQLRNRSLEDCSRLATAFSLSALSRIEPGIASPAAVESTMSSIAIEEAASQELP